MVVRCGEETAVHRILQRKVWGQMQQKYNFYKQVRNVNRSYRKSLRAEMEAETWGAVGGSGR